MEYESILKEVTVLKKSEPQWKHLPIFWIMSMICAIRKDWSFYERYVTTIGNTIYVPDKDYLGYSLGAPNYEAIIRHEYCHVLQSNQDGWRYYVRYLLSSKYRMLYEIEAYCHQLAASRNYKGGDPAPFARNSVIANFTYGSIYMFHLPKRLKLNANQQALWNSMIERLVADASNLSRDEFVARYLRDYGRLQGTAYRQLERHVKRILDSI